MDRLILASASPRRRELLTRAGYAFLVRPVDADETAQGTSRARVRVLAETKARAAAAAFPGDVILAADTLVSLDGASLGKPRDRQDAARMLRALSGRRHEVYTGVCVIRAGRLLSSVTETGVRFRELSEREILDYIDTGEPMDKAGSYAIQGGAAAFVTGYDGAYDNVIGLPMREVARLLREIGYISAFSE